MSDQAVTNGESQTTTEQQTTETGAPGTEQAGAADGLHKALQAEREARRQAESRLKQLERQAEEARRAQLPEIDRLKTEHQEAMAKLAEYQRREAVASAVDRAIGELGQGYEIDRGRVLGLAMRMQGSPDELAEEVRGLVELVRRPKAAAITGQPARTDAGTANAGLIEAARRGDTSAQVRLSQIDPAAFDRVMSERAAANKFQAGR